MAEDERMSFNINAELYENEFSELAVKLPGEKVYGHIASREDARFQHDVVEALEKDRLPAGWEEIPAHHLNARGWHCIARLGYLDGDPERPAVEFDVPREDLGPAARSYLADALGG